MRIKAQLIPQRTRGNITIVGSYRDRDTDRDVYLLSSGKKVVQVLEDSDRVFQHSFEAGFPLTFSFDLENFQDQAVIDFWKNHPLVKTEGYVNKNIVAEQFYFEIKEETIRIEYDAIISKLECVSHISKMNDQERIDLTFALGGDPREMGPKEVFVKLIGLTLNGIGIAKRDVVKNFLTVRASERQATIYANKAIQYQIVKQEGSVYKVAGRNAGTSVDSVIALILSNSDLFENYIKPEVDKVDSKTEASALAVNPLELPEEIVNLIPASGAAEKRKAKKDIG